MKSKIISLIALLVFFWHVLPAQWNVVPSGTYLHLHDIAFADADHAWIAADSSTLLNSTDGGLTWSQQQLSIPFFPPLVSVEFIDADTGYALPEFGNAWRTDDGGATWIESTEFGFNACYGMEMGFGSDAQYFTQRGCFGDNGIFTRTDSGMSYSYLNSTPPFGGSDALHDIEWINTDVAIAMGDNNLVYRTKDKGATWDLLFTRDTLMDWKAVVFENPSNGWAITSDEFWPLWYSNDAGLTWHLDSTWLATFFYPTHRAVDFNNGFVFAGGDIQWSPGGLISERSDVSFMYYDVPQPVSAFGFPSLTVGFAVGDSGMILRRDSIMMSSEKPVVKETASFQLFPNPASESVTMQWESPLTSDAVITLRDLSGREMMQVKHDSHSPLTLSLTGLSAGLYFVECISEDTRQTKKLILQ